MIKIAPSLLSILKKFPFFIFCSFAEGASVIALKGVTLAAFLAGLSAAISTLKRPNRIPLMIPVMLIPS